MSKELVIYGGYKVMVDDEDYDLVASYRWHILRRRPGEPAYAVSNYRVGKSTKSFYMHRLLLGAKRGQMIDHVDGNGLNNTRGNLRLCTIAQNAFNRRKVCGSSQFKGVVKRKSRAQVWMAQIKVNGKMVHLGSFHDEMMAALAYNKAALEYFGGFARLNEVQVA